MEPAWPFRPHHLLCWQTFRGHGYTPRFVANFQALIEQAGPDQPLRVAIAPDVICRACPHQTGSGCTFQDKVVGIDQRVAQSLELQDGQLLSLDEGVARTEGRLNSLIEHCCTGCEWQTFCLDLTASGGEQAGHQLE